MNKYNDPAYKAALDLSIKVWTWLFENPGKEKEESPYYTEIFECQSDCPMCQYMRDHYENQGSIFIRCESCPLYTVYNGISKYECHPAFAEWQEIDHTLSVAAAYHSKLCCARIVGILKRDRKKCTQQGAEG